MATGGCLPLYIHPTHLVNPGSDFPLRSHCKAHHGSEVCRCSIGWSRVTLGKMRAIVLVKDVTVSAVSMSYYHHGLGPKTHLTLITALLKVLRAGAGHEPGQPWSNNWANRRQGSLG